MDLLDAHSKATELVKEVGKFIKTEFSKFKPESIEHKGFNDLVSYVDKEAEKQLVNGLGQIIPDSGFIAEEGTSTKKGEKYNWIIDPLDGTTNFIHGLPVFSVSVALQQNDKLVAGIVYEINRDECFHAVEGRPAMLNDKEITVNNRATLKDGLIATGFPYNNFEKMDAYLAILKHLMQNSHGLRRLGSAAVDLAYVACGRYEGFFEYNLNAWDVAAGAYIVKKAGGEVSLFNKEGDYIFDREILAAPQKVHSDLQAVIKKYWNHE